MPGGRPAPRDRITQEAHVYGLTNVRFEKCPRGVLYLIADTPSGETYRVRSSRWTEGQRPPPRMFRDIPGELAEYGLTFVEFFFKKTSPHRPRHRYLRAMSPAGEEYTTRVSHWISGAAKPPLKYRRNIKAEVEAYGLVFVGVEMGTLPNGSQCSTLIYDNGGVQGRMQLSAWFLGRRPGRSGGRYKGRYLDDHPEQANTPTTLYFLRFRHNNDGETFYKVGVTVNPIKLRFYDAERNGYSYEVLFEKVLPLKEALEVEQRTISDNRHVQYIPAIRFPNGRTECFSEDVFSTAALAA